MTIQIGAFIQRALSIRIYSPFFPFPVTEGAYQVIYDQARCLANHHKVELISWRTDEADAKASLLNLEPRPFSTRIRHQSFYSGRRPESPLGRVTRVGRAILTGKPSPALFYYPTEDIPRWIEVAQSQETPDIGIYHYSFAALWKKALNRKFERKSVCYLHNLEADLFEIRTSKEVDPIKRAILQLNTDRLRRLEGELLQHFDELWFISEADRQDYSRRYKVGFEKLRTVVPSFDPEIFRLAQKSPRENLTIGFLGKLDFEPNRQGILWFIKEVAPLLAVRGFQGQVWIGGKNADYELKSEALKFPFMTFKGFVDRLSDWYSNVDIALAPHFQGSGTRIKLLDALSFGTPVLCHSAATDRIDESLRRLPAVLIRQTANEWAETLLNTAELKKVCAEFKRFPTGLDGEKIYSFLELETPADKAGEEAESKTPPLDR